MIFKQRFYVKTQFLFWNDQGTVSIAKEVTPEQRRRIAGDAIEIIRLRAFTKPTVFVEDAFHSIVIQEMALALSVEVAISECGNKSNLRSLYKLSLSEGGWRKAFFIEDGDGEGNPYPGSVNFVHLDRYCMETYFLDIPTAARVCGQSEDNMRAHLLQAVLASKERIFKRNKFFDFLVDYLRVERLTSGNLAKLDASAVIDTFLSRVGLESHAYVKAYINECYAQGRMRDLLPSLLVDLLEGLHPAKDVA